MINRVKTAIAEGIILCVIPVIALGQTFNSMPATVNNYRFYNDIFSPVEAGYTVGHPGLTLNGFDNGGDNSHGYGLRQILQILYTKGEDPLMEANYNQIVTISQLKFQNPASSVYNTTGE